MIAQLEKQQVEPKVRVRLKTWSEAAEYFKSHLTPVDFGPKGQPIYAQAEIEALNIELPEDFWMDAPE